MTEQMSKKSQDGVTTTVLLKLDLRLGRRYYF